MAMGRKLSKKQLRWFGRSGPLLVIDNRGKNFIERNAKPLLLLLTLWWEMESAFLSVSFKWILKNQPPNLNTLIDILFLATLEVQNLNTWISYPTLSRLFLFKLHHNQEECFKAENIHSQTLFSGFQFFLLDDFTPFLCQTNYQLKVSFPAC